MAVSPLLFLRSTVARISLHSDSVSELSRAAFQPLCLPLLPFLGLVALLILDWEALPQDLREYYQ